MVINQETNGVALFQFTLFQGQDERMEAQQSELGVAMEECGLNGGDGRKMMDIRGLEYHEWLEGNMVLERELCWTRLQM